MLLAKSFNRVLASLSLALAAFAMYRAARAEFATPPPQVKWRNDIIGHSRLLQQNLPEAEVIDS